MEENDKSGYVQSKIPDKVEKTAGQAVYIPLLENLLIYESARKSSLEQRGGTVITTTGVLVSLLFGFAAVVTNAKDFALPGASRVFLAAALVLFVLAAVGGIIINWPLGYYQIPDKNLRRITGAKYWNGPPEIAARRLAQTRVSILEHTRKLNRIKAHALLAAMILQILAVIALAASVTIMLIETN